MFLPVEVRVEPDDTEGLRLEDLIVADVRDHLAHTLRRCVELVQHGLGTDELVRRDGPLVLLLDELGVPL